MSRNEQTFIARGNLGRDPKFGTTSKKGVKWARFSFAAENSWYDKASNKWKEKTEWIPVIAWGKWAEMAERELQKGTRVYFEGSYTASSWTTNGQKRYGHDFNATCIEVISRGKPKFAADEHDTVLSDEDLGYDDHLGDGELGDDTFDQGDGLGSGEFDETETL